MEKLFLSTLILSLSTEESELDDEKIEIAETFSENYAIDLGLTPLP